MWTFQDQYTQFQDMAKDYNTDVLVIGKRNINMGQKILETDMGYPPEEETRTITTTTSDTYNLPENFIKLIEIYVTVGTTRYLMDQVPDETSWQVMKRRTAGTTSNYTTHVFLRQKTFEIYPTPVDAGNSMTMIYEALSKDLINANYTTGTITTLANGGTAVTGSGSTWTDAMVGRYIKINSDGQWYRITARGGNTSLTIANPYQGGSIAAGTESYTIGEIPRTPPATHILPVYFALARHFEGPRGDKTSAGYYQRMFDNGKEWAKTVFNNRYSSQVIPSIRHLRQRALLNPNWFPQNLT